MKSTSVSTKIITILLLLAVIGYFAVQGYNYFVSPETTTLVYRYHSERSIALRGYVVRDEQVVDCNETLIELKHAEGERVGQGDTIASVYRSADALNATQQLETLRAQKEQLEYAKSASSDAATALRLDTDIREQIISVRAAYESGAYSSLDTLIPQLKTTVLKREYAYNGSDDLTAKLDELNAQITALSGAASGGTTRITAPVSGTYSAVADGYESVLTPEVLETMTPSQLSSAAPQSVSTTVGKLIQGSAWYFAANVNEENAASLKENSRLTLRMASGVLKSTRYLSYMTLLREQNAELIISAYDGLRVPKNALRVDENGVSGVYCLVGRVAYFKPVSIVYQGSDYCLVEPGTIEAATESQKSLYTLRPNDEVIVSAGELYNGKVVD